MHVEPFWVRCSVHKGSKQKAEFYQKFALLALPIHFPPLFQYRTRPSILITGSWLLGLFLLRQNHLISAASFRGVSPRLPSSLPYHTGWRCDSARGGQ